MKTKQMALDALRELLSICDAGFSVRYDANKAIAALEADIAQAVEPVASWEVFQNNEWEWCKPTEVAFYRSCNKPVRPLYTTPPEPAVNAELLDACKAIVAWDDAENSAPEYQSDGGAHWRWRQSLCVDAFDKARAAIAKATS